ncbi:MAG: N-acetyltransferase [Dehalococcoidia bacterium]|nr:N-acetyltransferase [Dehalococcoidia bacterium]
MFGTAPEIRDAVLADIPAITAIYAHAVLNTVASLDIDQPTLASQTEWFTRHDERHPVLIAVSDCSTLGWASLSEWSSKAGYRETAEASVYVSPEHHGEGLGTVLLQALIERARSASLHVIVARISTSNHTSLRLAERCGFAHVGTMRESGFKFGEWVDVEVMQLVLGSPNAGTSCATPVVTHATRPGV